MKRMFSILLSAALLLGLLPACQQPEPSPSPSPAQDWSVSELAELAFEHCGREDPDGLEAVNAEMDRDWMTAYLENAYGLEVPWEDAAVIRATGASAFELTVLRLEDESAAVRASSSLMGYIFSRQGDFAGYAPAEANMVASGGISQSGVYAALFICPDPNGAQAAFMAALEGNPLPTAAVDATQDVKELRDILVAEKGMDGAALELLDSGNPDALNACMEDAYGLTEDQWVECAIARGTGDSAFEVAVMRVADGDASGDMEAESNRVNPVAADYSDVEERLNDYLDAREAAFSGSDQSDMLYQALVITSGPYLVLLACENAEEAGMTFVRAAGTGGFGYSSRHRFPSADSDYPDRCKFTPPNEDDMSLYDTSAIQSAWRKGDPSGLSDYDRDIYDQAKQVLDEVLANGMSDYEKEEAIYGWIVQNVNYDWTHQDRMKETPRESFTPYGGLVNHTAICLGYATTFQLLCDLAGVECVTVVGAAHMSSSDHGWNMVRLNGAWYCVDVTWDANAREQAWLGQREYWNYFNVTSDYMAGTDHQWDYANTPEAVTEGNGLG